MTTILKLWAKLDGKKTYISALAIALMGVVDMINGDYATGGQKIAEAAAMAGLRRGVATAAGN